MKQSIGRTLTGLVLGVAVLGGAAQAAGKIAFISERDGNKEIYVMNSDGSGQTNLTNTPSRAESEPSFSANGSKIAYTDGTEIYTMDGTGANQAAISTGGGRKDQPDFGPDGSKILFSADGTDKDIFVIASTGGTITKVVNNTYGDYEGDWSPDGGKIAFKGFPDAGGREEIYECNADGSGQLRLTTAGGNNRPRFSPDGTRIVFESKRDNGNSQIYVMNADGSDQTRLTSNTYNDTLPTWSPDGSQIAFTSNRDGNQEIYVMNADGSSPVRLTNNAASDVHPTWFGTRPRLSLTSATVVEGDSGTIALNFTVSLSAASSEAVSFDYATADGSATAGTDYVGVSGTATIAAGETTKTISVLVNGDTANEADETLSLRVSHVVGALVDVAVPNRSLARNPADGHLYEIVNASTTFAAAKAGAQARTYGAVNGHLATITSQAEQNVLAPAFSGKIYWLGAIQGASPTEPAGGFAWVTGEPFDYTSWSDSEPNNAGGVENALATKDTGLWNDVPDTTPIANYVVEYDVNSPLPTSTLEATGTITNDDVTPKIAVSDATVTEGDGSSPNAGAAFTVSLSQAKTQTVTVHYETADGSAKAGLDFSAATGDLTFAPGETEKTVTILALADLLDEPNETFSLKLSAPTNAEIGDGTGIGTIVDNDPTPTLSIQQEVTLYEGRTAATQPGITVSLSAASGQTVTVKYATSDYRAKAPGDYTKSTGTLTFAPGETTKVIQIPIVDDKFNEPTEDFKVTLSVPFHATLLAKVTTPLIMDDDGQPSFSVSDDSVTEGKTGTVDAVFTVKLSAPSNRPITVRYVTADGTAVAGLDYNSSPSRQLDFGAHEVSKTIKIKVRGDSIDEPNEQFFFKLSKPVNASIADDTGVCTILDDDATPVLSINSPAVSEGNDGTKVMNFTLKLSRLSSSTVTVNVKTVGLASTDGMGLATSGVDYEALPATVLTFAPGQSSKTVAVKIKGDTLDEADEAFGLELSGAAGATIGGDTGTGTILDDDASPVLSIHDITVTEGNSGTTTARFSVTLSAASARAVTANYATTDGTATASNDYGVKSGSIVFAPGQTSLFIEIPIKGDTVPEPKEQFRVILSGIAGATSGQKTGIGTILDDDAVATATSAKSS